MLPGSPPVPSQLQECGCPHICVVPWPPDLHIPSAPRIPGPAMPPASLHFIPCEEAHSSGDRKTRAVLGQGWGWPMTLEESSEGPHGASQASCVAWWPPGGAKAGRGSARRAGGGHTICGRPLCWQPSSPSMAAIQLLVLSVQMSFQMPSALPTHTRSGN